MPCTRRCAQICRKVLNQHTVTAVCRPRPHHRRVTMGSTLLLPIHQRRGGAAVARALQETPPRCHLSKGTRAPCGAPGLHVHPTRRRSWFPRHLSLQKIAAKRSKWQRTGQACRRRHVRGSKCRSKIRMRLLTRKTRDALKRKEGRGGLRHVPQRRAVSGS